MAALTLTPVNYDPLRRTHDFATRRMLLLPRCTVVVSPWLGAAGINGTLEGMFALIERKKSTLIVLGDRE